MNGRDFFALHQLDQLLRDRLKFGYVFDLEINLFEGIVKVKVLKDSLFIKQFLDFLVHGFPFLKHLFSLEVLIVRNNDKNKHFTLN